MRTKTCAAPEPRLAPSLTGGFTPVPSLDSSGVPTTSVSPSIAKLCPKSPPAPRGSPKGLSVTWAEVAAAANPSAHIAANPTTTVFTSQASQGGIEPGRRADDHRPTEVGPPALLALRVTSHLSCRSLPLAPPHL